MQICDIKIHPAVLTIAGFYIVVASIVAALMFL